MSKKTYRVRNWSKYNRALKNRGAITIWFSEEVISQWYETERSGKRGRPMEYKDVAIECGLTLKAVFKLPFRATEGLMISLMKLLKLEIKVPDYSLLCKRQKFMSVALKSGVSGEKIDLVVDTTGLKVYGEGEWKVRQHGWLKHRLWRKLHIGVNALTHEIEAMDLTDLGVQDCEGFSRLLKRIQKPLNSGIGDGAYDRFSCYEEAQERGFKMITPPQRNSRTSKERTRNKKKVSAEAVQARDEAILGVRALGRAAWKVAVGYHKRSLAETAMYRIKTLLGHRLSTKTIEHQKVEATIWCKIINKMTCLGMPESVAI